MRGLGERHSPAESYLVKRGSCKTHMKITPERPISITVAVILIAFYAAMLIVWDLVSPFERPYAQGPVSVVLGFRVYGVWAQLAHGLQLFVALALMYGLWTMQWWGWQLVVGVTAYMLLSVSIWVTVYQEFQHIFFALFYLIVVNVFLALTFPHREKFGD
jgi:hypothetical protein